MLFIINIVPKLLISHCEFGLFPSVKFYLKSVFAIFIIIIICFECR